MSLNRILLRRQHLEVFQAFSAGKWNSLDSNGEASRPELRLS